MWVTCTPIQRQCVVWFSIIARSRTTTGRSGSVCIQNQRTHNNEHYATHFVFAIK
jgi:hypothetical protein